MFWGSDIIAEDILPPQLFDTGPEAPQLVPSTPTHCLEAPPISNFSQFSSRLPTLDDDDDVLQGGNSPEEDVSGTNAVPWDVTKIEYERLGLEVQSYAHVLPPGCSLPSRNTLTRHLEKYLVCAHEFLPFIHVATFSVNEKDVELLLAAAVVGALYRFECSDSYNLYFMAKAILMEKIRQRELQVASSMLSGQKLPEKGNDLGEMQTFILLISFASWANEKVVPDALSMGSRLGTMLKGAGISKADEMPQNIGWVAWVTIEERRRTLLSAYVLFNLQSIAFNAPLLIVNQDLGLCLPGYADQWKAKNATEWNQTTRQVERSFQGTLRNLLDGVKIPADASISSFANYLLIHGLLQLMCIERHYGSTGLIRPENFKSYETALRIWQESWELTGESSLDPLSPKGPFGLTAAALLRLAYICLNTNLRPGSVLSNDVGYVSRRISCHPARLPHVDRAILHAAHALSLPVRLGVAFMALNKTAIWTIEHSLSSLECAFLLKDWLEMIAEATQSQPHGTKG